MDVQMDEILGQAEPAGLTRTYVCSLFLIISPRPCGLACEPHVHGVRVTAKFCACGKMLAVRCGADVYHRPADHKGRPYRDDAFTRKRATKVVRAACTPGWFRSERERRRPVARTFGAHDKEDNRI